MGGWWVGGSVGPWVSGYSHLVPFAILLIVFVLVLELSDHRLQRFDLFLAFLERPRMKWQWEE